ncbi:MAG: alpha/beta fold hydrolase [Phycisphaerales bacterium]
MTTAPASQSRTVPATSPSAGSLPERTVPIPGAKSDIPACVVDVGQGRPVVFLHGLVGLNDHWEDVVRDVRSRVRCVMLEIPLLELRGDDCSIDGVTTLTARFLERHLPGERAVLVGNSFGGHVALRLALDRPELVGGLVLAGSSGLNERTMVREIRLKPNRAWMRRKIAELFFDESTMREADVDRAYAELSDRNKVRAMLLLSKSARRNHLGERIHAIACPTLVMWGREDIVTPPDAAQEFEKAIRDCRVVWFDRCGHAPMLEKPAEFARALRDFADELDRRPAR